MISEEISEIDVDLMKRFVGTSYITARNLYKDNFTFRTTHSMFVTTNYETSISKTDHGTWRRFLLVVFPYTFRKKAEDVKTNTDRLGDQNLKPRLLKGDQGQHDAIVTWVVEGAYEWYRDYESKSRVLLPTPKIESDTLEWRASSDRIMGFWRTELVADREACVLATDLLLMFNRWLVDNGHHPWSKEKFSKDFKTHEETARHGVVLVKTRKLRGLWLPFVTNPPQPVPDQAWVYRGVRYATPTDRAQEPSD